MKSDMDAGDQLGISYAKEIDLPSGPFQTAAI